MLSINRVHNCSRSLSSGIYTRIRCITVGGSDKSAALPCSHCIQGNDRHRPFSTCSRSNVHSLPIVSRMVDKYCSLCRNSGQVRTLRYWWRGRNFPPNKGKDTHHFFYPPLVQQLREREAVNNPVEIIDIGLNGKLFNERIGLETEPTIDYSRRRRNGRSTASGSNPDGRIGADGKKIELSSSTDLISLVDVSIEKEQFDYNRYKMAEGHTDQGKDGLKELAHHYHIYRDLFSSPSLISLDTDKLPTAKIPHIAPMADVPHIEVLEKWFPGSLRYKPVPAKKIYHFTPHVPIYAEFAVKEQFIIDNEDGIDEETVLESKDAKEKNVAKDGKTAKDAEAKDVNEKVAADVDTSTLITSPVFNGNLIEPLYASSKPSVVIDVSGGVGMDNGPKSYFDSVDCGSVKLLGHKSDKLYTLMLLNLDTIFGDANPVCHWMVSNIGGKESIESMSFLPIYGIRGLGYHRYVFLLYQHDKEIKMDTVDTMVMKERQLEPQQFMKSLDESSVPVGLSWFQSQWDSYSQTVFHDQLNMRAPVYEYIEPPEKPIKQAKYPVLAPFNIYLDHFRHPKELAEEALAERLNSIDPFNYEANLDTDPLPNAYGQPRDDKTLPSWMHSKIWKKRNRLGQWRPLRPVSAKVPLNNNPDLDRPIWPFPSRLELPNKYPDGRRRPKPLRDTKWIIPPPQHPTYRIEHEDIHEIQKELDKEE